MNSALLCAHSLGIPNPERQSLPDLGAAILPLVYHREAGMHGDLHSYVKLTVPRRRERGEHG